MKRRIPVARRLLSFVLTIALFLGMIWINPGEAMAGVKISFNNKDTTLNNQFKIYVGQTYKLELSDNGIFKGLKSSDKKIVSIRKTKANICEIKALSPGNVIIDVKYYDKRIKKRYYYNGSMTFTVLQRAESVSCESLMILHVGEKAKLHPTITPANSTDVLSFKLIPTNVVKINSKNSGITAIAPGTTAIIIYAKEKSSIKSSDKSNKTATCKVIVLEKDQSLSMALDDGALSGFNSFTYDLTKPADDQTKALAIDPESILISPDSLKNEGNFSFNWYEAKEGSINEGSDALVSNGSQVFEPDLSRPGKRYYYCRVEYKLTDNVSATAVSPVATVTVAGDTTPTSDPDPSVPSSDKLTLQADKSVIRKGESTQLHASSSMSVITQLFAGSMKNSLKPAYTSGNIAVATVDGNGLVTGHTPGTATVTATLGALTASLDITVLPPQINRVSLDPDIKQIYIDEPVRVTAAIDPSDARGVITYDSSDSSIATVTGDGTVTGISEGDFNLLVIGDGQLAASFPVSVIRKTAGSLTATVDGTHKEQTIRINETTQINAALTPEGTPIEYTSSDQSIASVNSNGLVTGKGAGEAVITVRAGELTAQINITVMSGPQKPQQVTPPVQADEINITVMSGPQKPVITSDLPDWVSINSEKYLYGNQNETVGIVAAVSDNGTLSYEWHAADTNALTDEGDIINDLENRTVITSENIDALQVNPEPLQFYNYVFVRIINTLDGETAYVDSKRMHLYTSESTAKP